MPDRQTGGAAGEAAVGDQCAGLAKSLGFQVAGRVQHLLHARPALGTLVADQDHVTCLDPVTQDRLDRSVLALEDPCRTREFQDRFIDTRCLDDATLLREIAVQHGQTAIPGVGVFDIADTAGSTVEVELGPLAVLAERDLCRYTAGTGQVALTGRGLVVTYHVPGIQSRAHGGAVHRVTVAVDQPAAIEFGEDADHAARTVHVFHVVLLGGRRDLAQVRHPPTHAIDVGHREIHRALVRCGQQVQHGIGRAAHGDIQRDRILEGLEGGDAARQYTRVVLLVVTFCQFHHKAPGLEEQVPALGVGRQQRAIARKRQPQRLGQAVH